MQTHNRPLYMEKIAPFIDGPYVKILTGVRRSGKSTLLKLIMEKLRVRGIHEEQLIYLHFDSLEYMGQTASDILKLIKTRLPATGRAYLFLDEVQEIEGWERLVNTLFTDFDTDLYVTGSNSRLMASEIASYLTGRYISIEVFPLSFAEYLTFKRAYASVTAPREELYAYLRHGGFPGTCITALSPDASNTLVRDILNAIFLSDIVKRNGIRKIDHLQRVLHFVLSNVGNLFSVTSLTRFLKAEQRPLNYDTLTGFLEMLCRAYLIYPCPRYDLKGKEILRLHEKYYLADTSLRYSVLGYSPDTVASSLENLVYLELRRRGYTVFTGESAGFEIDFVAIKQESRLYIQVTQEISSEKTAHREYAQLLKIEDNYPKYVLRTDPFAAGNYQGIITMHVADFLLSDTY